MTAANSGVVTAVTPVVDYEPQIELGAERARPSAVAWRRPDRPAGHLRAVAPPGRPDHAGLSPVHRSAAAFADAALRTVLEVIDLRRPAVQLRPLMAAGLADTVVAFTRARPIHGAAAVLRRVRVQGCDAREQAFEVAGAYTRDSRRHAIACRIELTTTARGGHWQVVALHLG